MRKRRNEKKMAMKTSEGNGDGEVKEEREVVEVVIMVVERKKIR